MNKRIKELAKQAGFYKYGDHFEEIIEHFAELVRQDYLRELKALEPVAHMYPSTLKDFEHGEKADYAYSIEMGNMKTGEVTVPLYALDEVTK